MRLGNGNGFSLEADSNEVYVNGTATINGAVTVNGNPITVSGVSEAIKLVAADAGTSAVAYLAFYDSGNVRKGFIGDGSPSNADIYIKSDSGALRFGDSTNSSIVVVSNGSTSLSQPSTTGAVPTLLLSQPDLSEEFIEFSGTVATGNPIDTAALGSYYGKVRVSVNGTFKWIALYN